MFQIESLIKFYDCLTKREGSIWPRSSAMEHGKSAGKGEGGRSSQPCNTRNIWKKSLIKFNWNNSFFPKFFLILKAL